MVMLFGDDTVPWQAKVIVLVQNERWPRLRLYLRDCGCSSVWWGKRKWFCFAWGDPCWGYQSCQDISVRMLLLAVRLDGFAVAWLWLEYISPKHLISREIVEIKSAFASAGVLFVWWVLNGVLNGEEKWSVQHEGMASQLVDINVSVAKSGMDSEEWFGLKMLQMNQTSWPTFFVGSDGKFNGLGLVLVDGGNNGWIVDGGYWIGGLSFHPTTMKGFYLSDRDDLAGGRGVVPLLIPARWSFWYMVLWLRGEGIVKVRNERGWMPRGSSKEKRTGSVSEWLDEWLQWRARDHECPNLVVWVLESTSADRFGCRTNAMHAAATAVVE